MLKVSNVIRNIIGACPNSPTFLLAASISNSWEEIAGPDLYDMSSLKDVKYTGANKITVYIDVISAVSLLARYSQENIKDKIRNLSRVEDISIVFKHCSNIYRLVENKKTSEKETTKVSCSVDYNFENKSLKSALEKLKTEIQNAA